MNKEFLLYSDVPEVTLELVTLALKLGAEEVDAVLLGATAEQVKTLSAGGVRTIYTVPGDSFTSERAVDALEKIYRQAQNPLILIGATKRGREIAPRLATRLEIGCISDALKLELDGESARADRLVWGGNAIATVSASGDSTVITIPPRANERASGTSSPKIVEIKLELKTERVKITGRKERSRGQVNMKDADVIVSAGRGFKKKEDLALLDGLASVLNGVVGASRPLTSDLGWMPEDRQVGLSGTTVKPKLYIAVGISGQIQHLTGMRDSKVVVAINSDKNAPIFQECDYGIVGDLYAVIPELEKALKSELGK